MAPAGATNCRRGDLTWRRRGKKTEDQMRPVGNFWITRTGRTRGRTGGLRADRADGGRTGGRADGTKNGGGRADEQTGCGQGGLGGRAGRA